MRGKIFSIGLAAALAIFAVTQLVTSTWAATQEKVLHNFKNNTKQGNTLYAGLIFDAAGNLYGTTASGGDYGVGTVFELMPKAGGGWTETVLHNFKNNGRDGEGPYAGLIFDAAGNLYGTTASGGNYGVGTVFELTPKAGGGWTEKVLHNFENSGKKGNTPYAGLIFDAAGNLYGTTVSGGYYGVGTVFELTPQAGGGWTETVLHNFKNNTEQGNTLYGGLIFDGAGNLYGTTVNGGYYGVGTVFKLTPKAGGGWTETVLHNFDDNGTDGYSPYASLIFDAAGNLYGATTEGGNGYGTVFELTPKAGGGWTEKVLYRFNGLDGLEPYASLIFDAAGNLYGTTVAGGTQGYGTVFELTYTGGGDWGEQVLYNFNGRDGSIPYASLIFDAAGNLYGTTTSGGHYGVGTVFEIIP